MIMFLGLIGGSRHAIWLALWRGTADARHGLSGLFWAFVKLGVSLWLWDTAIRVAHFAPPVRDAGAGLAIASLVFAAWGMWSLVRAFGRLGLRGILLMVLVLYFLVATFRVLTVFDNRPLERRVLTQLVQTGQWGWTQLRTAGEAVLGAPDEFQLAYHGKRTANAPQGFPLFDPAATPIRVVAQPAPASQSQALKVGGYARAVSSDGQRVAVRSNPSSSSSATAYLPTDERLLILNGPRSTIEGRWWKVHASQGEGWCIEKDLKLAK